MTDEVNYCDMTDKKLKEYIQFKIESDYAWALRALIVVYGFQTEEERNDPETVHESNGRGFQQDEQEFLSSLATQHLRHVILSENQTKWIMTLMPKYAGQLVPIVREKYPRPKKTRKRKPKPKPKPEEIVEIQYARCVIKNESKTLEAVTGDLGFDPSLPPPKFKVTSLSGSNDTIFTFDHARMVGETADLFVYVGKINGKDWEFDLYPGDANPVPTLEEAIAHFAGIPGEE